MPTIFQKIRYNFVNKVYPITFHFDYQYGLNRYERDIPIVVSLTTIPQRIDCVHLCINQLLKQSMKPDHVILWLSSLNFTKKIIPEKLQELEKRGLEVRWVDEDLNCHKKYFYAMQEFPKCIIVTVDDDVFYSKKLIEKLYKSYIRFPNAVSAMRVHKMSFDEVGEVLPYIEWEHNYRAKESMQPRADLMATGCGGVLYPPHILPQEAFDKENIVKYCLCADDIWLKYMETSNSVKTVVAQQYECDIWGIEGSQETSLNKNNVGQNKNDLFMKRMHEVYNVSFKN